jgi:hypothetical protein
MNYFRSVQKRLAFDAREFFTRERALNGSEYEEALIGPQYGRVDGTLRAKAGGGTGPGGINQTSLRREYDLGSDAFEIGSDDVEVKADPVSLKGFKYNKRFDPRLTPTCPCVPRFHSTFGRPTLYEDLSAELERK